MANKINRKSAQNAVLRLLGPMFYVTLVVFLVLYARNLDWSKLSLIDINWVYLLIASGLAMVFRFWGAAIWLVLLHSLGAKTVTKSKAELFYVYAKSWLGRYIPGTAPWIIGKVLFASRLGVSKNKLAVSSLLEGALQIIVTLVIAFTILLFDTRLNIVDQNFRILMVLIIVAGVIAVVPTIFNRLISRLYSLVKKKVFPIEHYAKSSTTFKGIVMYSVGSFIGGLSFFFVVKSVYPFLSYSDLLFVLGASNLASAVSMLAVFAPSGLGVRESLQVLLLSIIMPAEVAVVVAATTRVWSIVVDILFYFLSYAISIRGRT